MDHASQAGPEKPVGPVDDGAMDSTFRSNKESALSRLGKVEAVKRNSTEKERGEATLGPFGLLLMLFHLLQLSSSPLLPFGFSADPADLPDGTDTGALKKPSLSPALVLQTQLLNPENASPFKPPPWTDATPVPRCQRRTMLRHRATALPAPSPNHVHAWTSQTCTL